MLQRKKRMTSYLTMWVGKIGANLTSDSLNVFRLTVLSCGSSQLGPVSVVPVDLKRVSPCLMTSGILGSSDALNGHSQVEA